jgi:hypothetical protein
MPEAQLAGLRPRACDEVFGFPPHWEVRDTTLALDYSVSSTIAYQRRRDGPEPLKTELTGRRRPAGAAGPAPT